MALAYVENLTLTGNAAIDGTGNNLDNILTGNGANNVLIGYGGNDTLNGGGGIDTLTGGTGNDTYVVDTTTDIIIENSGEGTDIVQSSVTFSLASLANVENLTLTGAAAINGTGDDFDNVITGNGAANTLTGGGGNDTLNGGLGVDTLVGGPGDDTYVVENASDIITESAGEGTDLVLASNTIYALAVNVENLTLTGNSNINGTGNALDNVITGNISANILTGGLGADTMIGGAGNDT
jgi:Ca2+-binding RTX toxin-like protein